MGSGNVKVLRKTLESMSTVCDEIIYGDLLLWGSDRDVVIGYEKEFNLKRIPFGFDSLFKYGFSFVLNDLASHATNDYVMYLNTSEIIGEDYGILDVIKNNPDCNAFYFNHKKEFHRWFRTYNRKELKWSGRIHESLEGEYRPYHKPIFQMVDLPKDMDDIHKAGCLDSLKEAVYFEQYLSIVDRPELLGETDPSWITFCTEGYNSFVERLVQKGNVYLSLKRGDYPSFMKALEAEEYRQFKSTIACEFQGDPKYLNK